MRNLIRALAAFAALAIVAPAFAADTAAGSTDTTQMAPKTHKKMSKKVTRKHASSKSNKAGAADTSATPK